MSRLKTDAIRNVNASVDGITLDTSGNIAIPNELQLADKIVHTGDTNTAIRFPSNDTITFETNGDQALEITSGGGVKFNDADTPGSTTAPAQILNHSGGLQFYGSSAEGTHRNIIFGTNDRSAGERLRITSTGCVGIKTTANLNGALLAIGDGQGANHPSGAHIKIAPSANIITFLDSSSNTSDTGNIQLWNTVYNNSSAKIELYHPAANTGGIKFYTHDGTGLNNNFSIDNAGVLYNTCRSNGACNLTLKKVTASNGIDYFQCRNKDNTLRMVINYDGNVRNTNNSYGQTSDSKLKENIVNANSQWDDIKAIKVRNFNFKESTGLSTHKQIGVVAQEIETVSAGLVYESIDRDLDTGEDLGTKTKSVKYSILYIKAIKALQEAITKIETLETKVAALEGS